MIYAHRQTQRERSSGSAWRTRASRVEKRHIKSTYANSTPATDGRIVVAWFGSQGVHAYDVNGRFLWKVDLGRLDLGAYDIPTYEWGPASSPIIWNDLVILQCDTQADSFLLALTPTPARPSGRPSATNFLRGARRPWRMTPAGPELVTNASNFIRGYDPRTGKELWRLGRSSKITAPTPIFADDLFVVASGRAPGAADLRRAARRARRPHAGRWQDEQARPSSGAARAAGLTCRRRSIYDGLLYVLANNGMLRRLRPEDGRGDLSPAAAASSAAASARRPVAADGKIYLSNEDGEILVVAAGRKFTHIATNSMGELLMATPALSEGVMYVRSSRSLFAVGRKR